MKIEDLYWCMPGDLVVHGEDTVCVYIYIGNLGGHEYMTPIPRSFFRQSCGLARQRIHPDNYTTTENKNVVQCQGIGQRKKKH